ncbi:unnamed protein product [Larinioides sclopetarius]|uniref:Uncharacterized protein n=1 Tax=Larinioides sclopetarius TaxID=280406 RepID=A0AAV2AQD2_9ARAC
MTCEQNARMVLGYLESEETVLRGVKEALESQLMRLQIDEMNLRVAYQNLKTKKRPETKKGMKVKKELEVKTELTKQETNSNKVALEVKPLHQGLNSKTEKNDEELPELLLEPCHLDPFSQIKMNDEELPELLLEPSHLMPFSDSKMNADEILEPLYLNSEGIVL